MGKELSIFARNIKYLRKDKKFTLAEIQDRTGFKTSTWSNYENGVSEPNFSDLITISQFFGITLDDFLLLDLENVHLLDETVIEKSKGKSAAKSASYGTSKGSKAGDFGTQKFQFTDKAGDPGWILVKMMQENGQKLDQLLIIAKEQAKK